MTARDYQRQRVYDWERTYLAAESCRWSVRLRHPNAKRLSLATCHAMVRQIHLDHGVGWRKVEIEDGRRRRRPCYEGLPGEPTAIIRLPRWTRSPRHVLHEAAHSLEDCLHFEGTSHGPVFVRIVLELWARYRGLDLGEMAASAQAAGVTVGSHPVLGPVYGAILPPPKKSDFSVAN